MWVELGGRALAPAATKEKDDRWSRFASIIVRGFKEVELKGLFSRHLVGDALIRLRGVFCPKIGWKENRKKREKKGAEWAFHEKGGFRHSGLEVKGAVWKWRRHVEKTIAYKTAVSFLRVFLGRRVS